jgi:type I restriction enzyme S subunit
MKSNYKPIGQYIQRVEHRNRDLKVTRLLGLSMTKEFRETTSNIVGTDMSVYRVMSKYQFACDFMSPIRVNKLPVVLKLDDEPNLVSPAYPVFEIKDKNELDPEYLMMWFRRTEFDRYATFKCDAAIRGGYEWTELCETLIPVPTITKQREIVKEYNIIQKRIALNQQLIQKLEETAQAIYKQWFVEFEFPDENGKPYKSNGGEMLYNDDTEMEIPKGWHIVMFEEIIDKIIDNRGKTPPISENGEKLLFETFLINNNQAFPSIGISNKNKFVSNEIYNKWFRAGHPEYLDILFGTVGNGIPSWTLTPKKVNFCIAQNIIGLRLKKGVSPFYVKSFFFTDSFKSQFSGRVIDTAQPSIRVSDIKTIKLIKPIETIMAKYHKLVLPIYEYTEIKVRENQMLSSKKDVLLARISTIEM